MPVYSDPEQLYGCARLLFQRIEKEVPGAANTVLGSRLLIRLNVQDPLGEIWINGRRRPLQTQYGPARLRPDLDITLKGDTLHRIMLGELSLTKAVGNGSLRVRGPVWKALVLADLFDASQWIYPQILRDQGIEA